MLVVHPGRTPRRAISFLPCSLADAARAFSARLCSACSCHTHSRSSLSRLRSPLLSTQFVGVVALVVARLPALDRHRFADRCPRRVPRVPRVATSHCLDRDLSLASAPCCCLSLTTPCIQLRSSYSPPESRHRPSYSPVDALVGASSVKLCPPRRQRFESLVVLCSSPNSPHHRRPTSEATKPSSPALTSSSPHCRHCVLSANTRG